MNRYYHFPRSTKIQLRALRKMSGHLHTGYFTRQEVKDYSWLMMKSIDEILESDIENKEENDKGDYNE